MERAGLSVEQVVRWWLARDEGRVPGAAGDIILATIERDGVVRRRVHRQDSTSGSERPDHRRQRASR